MTDHFFRYCCEFVKHVLFVWSKESLEKHAALLQDAIKVRNDYVYLNKSKKYLESCFLFSAAYVMRILKRAHFPDSTSFLQFVFFIVHVLNVANKICRFLLIRARIDPSDIFSCHVI